MTSLSLRKRRASLAKYLSSPTAEASLASLPSTDLQYALNAQKYAAGNNDVLEFIGDRVVNLACALISSKINHSPDQQTLVARSLSNNDTLGRIAHQLRLPQHARARIDPPDRIKGEAWSRRQVGSPPKVFADLFESYTGALFLRHGWHYTYAWLRTVYTPIAAAAARDALSTVDLAPSRWSACDSMPWPHRVQRSFEGFIKGRNAELEEAKSLLIETLPKSRVTNRREEIGLQLIKFWICEIALGVYPEVHCARDRGSHFLSSMTSALISDDTLGHLGLILSLSSYLPPSDPDFLSLYPASGSDNQSLSQVRPKLATIFKAISGELYLRRPTLARKWGHGLFKPLVRWSMDMLLSLGNRFRPVIDKASSAPPKPTQGHTTSGKSDDALDALLRTFEHLAIKPKIAANKPAGGAKMKDQETKVKTKKISIKINASWLLDDGEVEKGDAGSDADLKLEMDPYKLLDEGCSFPSPWDEVEDPSDDATGSGTNGSKTTMESGVGSKESKLEGEKLADAALVNGDSDGSQDMQFSSSETESDMEFSEESSYELAIPCAAEGENSLSIDGTETLVRVLKDLKINSIDKAITRDLNEDNAPTPLLPSQCTSSPRPSSPNALLPSQVTGSHLPLSPEALVPGTRTSTPLPSPQPSPSSLRTQKTEVQKKPNVKEAVVESDMEFSSSESSTGDADKSDMEFSSSDEDTELAPGGPGPILSRTFKVGTDAISKSLRRASESSPKLPLPMPSQTKMKGWPQITVPPPRLDFVSSFFGVAKHFQHGGEGSMRRNVSYSKCNAAIFLGRSL